MKADYYPTETRILLGRLMFFVCFMTVFFTLYAFQDRADAPVAPLPEYKIEPTTTITARP